MKNRIRINREQIQHLAGAAAYTRGAGVYRSNKVLDIHVDSLPDVDYIKAQVAGNYAKEYEVYLTFDRADNSVQNGYCECPAFESYGSLCKHCVATLLKYEDYLNDFQDNYEEDHLLMPPSLERLRGALAKKKRQTTKGLKEILQSDRFLSEEVVMLEEENYGKVRFEPHFTFSYYDVTIDFKVGITRMYVVKDLIEFAERMEQGLIYSYGKELEFRHLLAMFTKESKPLVEFALDWVRRNKEEHQETRFTYQYGYDSVYAKVRYIDPSSSDIDHFFEAVGEQRLNALVIGVAEKKWQIVEEDYQEKLRIIGEGTGVKLDTYYVPHIDTNNLIYYFDHGKIYKKNKADQLAVSDFRELLYRQENGELYLGEEDIPAFIRGLLPRLEEHYQLEYINFDPASYDAMPVTFEFYLDLPQVDFLTIKVLAVYGEDKYNIYEKEEQQSFRDYFVEAQVEKVINHYSNAFDDEKKQMALADDEDRMYELLSEGVEKLQLIGEVYVSDALKKKEYTPKVTVGLSLAGEKLEITMTSPEMSNAELFEVLSKYERKKKFYRLKNGSFVNMESESMQALLELNDGLGLRSGQLKGEVLQVPKFRALYLDNELREQKALPVTKDHLFKALIRNMKTVEDSEYTVPASLEDILRGYQKQGFYWLKTLKSNGFGGILADDMGLGKTLQVIAFLLSEQEQSLQEGRELQPSLVVSPASLVFNWLSELERYAPSLKGVMVVGTAAGRRQLLKEAKPGEILLTSYDLLRRDLDSYSEMKFQTMVIDEAQYIKNHNTQVAKAVKKVSADFKLALTGTPVENSLSELWSIFDYIMPGFFYTYGKFREEIEIPIVQENDEKAKIRLQKMLRPFVLRRLKRDVLTELPEKTEENYFAKLAGAQQKLYDAHVQRMRMLLDEKSDAEFKTSKIQILAELTKLRQLCCDPALLFEDYKGESVKLDLCLDLIKKAVAGGHKILLFSQFTSMLAIIVERLAAEEISHFVLTGATSKEKRAQLVEEFGQGKAEVFCISLKAGGTGLNLTAADIVIHYDPWWNQAVQNQATDRAHRIGQNNVVTVYKLIAKDTIEEKIVKIQEQKSQLADEILGGEGISAASFTKEELLELL